MEKTYNCCEEFWKSQRKTNKDETTCIKTDVVEKTNSILVKKVKRKTPTYL